jgi:DNA helicase-2/ATP-dependent DNA helicase PcrA
MKNNLLNPFQQEAVDHIEGPLLVLAGAGSGKTNVVTKKIAKLIDIGVNHNEILAVTFTNKAANEMIQRIEKLTFKNVLACTFHSLGAKILRESINHLGYSNNFTIYDEEDSLKLLKECFSFLKIKEDKGKLKKIRYKISTYKNNFIDLNDINYLSELTKIEIDIFRMYQSKLKTFNSLDFEDLLYVTVKLLKENLEILSYYQRKWSFILVDEYQDTNYVQYFLVKLLSANNQNICVVGDPDQSIYSFRGARYQNILNFDRDFENAKIIRLEKNYRSTPTILNAANHLIKNNTNRYEKNLYSENPDGEKIQIFKAESEQMEASFVVEKIFILYSKNKIKLNDIAIFYRTNFQSRVFEDFLLSKKIPYIIYGGISFYQRKEIKDILAFLKLLITDNDFLSFSRTINIPQKGFGKTTINKLFLISEKHQIPILEILKNILEKSHFFDEIRLNNKQKINLQNYLKNINDLKNCYQKNLDIDELISQILTKMKYLDYLKQDPESFEDRKENIDELITKANQWQKETNKNLQSFLEELALTSIKVENAHENSLKLMTLHNSKGLEFECVFIVGLEEDLFPHVNSKNTLDEIEEERRLFYVGMTRAKKYLYITHSQYRYIWGGTKLSTPSRFLRELDKKYLNDLTTDYDTKPNLEINLKNEKYYPGLKVFHKTFGIGIIQKIYQSSLGQTLDILFEEGNTTRSIVEKYAKLKIL